MAAAAEREERRERRQAEERQAEERRMEEERVQAAPDLMRGRLGGQLRGSKLPTPEFDGKTDVTKFRRNFEEVARLSGWNEREMALRLQKKKIGGKWNYFVKFLGYDNSFNDWVESIDSYNN